MGRVSLRFLPAAVLGAAALAALLGLAAAVPTAGFSPSTPNPAVGSMVVFTDTSGGAPTTWAWDFGDGGTSTQQNPTHVYRAAGVFTVRLTASNASGQSSTSQAVTVTSSGVLRLNAAHSFDVTLTATNQRTGASGSGVVIGQNDVYGYFSLPTLSGNAGNPEVIVKMVDASAIGLNYWVFYGTMTDLQYTISVKENATGVVKTYSQNPNAPSGQFDTSGFVGTNATPAPSPTPTPPPSGTARIDVDVARYQFTPGTTTPLMVTAGVRTTLVFTSTDGTHGFSGIPALGIPGTNQISSGDPSDPYSGGTNPVVYTVTFTAPLSARGNAYPFACTLQTCGPGHPTMTAVLQVN